MSDEHRTYITFDAPNQPKARPKLGFRDISGFEPLVKKQDTTNDKKINEWEELESISYFKALDLISEGPIEGFCDPAGNLVSGSGILKGIYLDNTPILNENDTINYRDVSTVLMHGTTGQDAIYTGQTGAFQWMEDFSYVSQTKSKGIVLPSASSFGGGPTASFDGHHTIQDSDVDWVALTFNIGRLNAINLKSDDGEIVPNSLKLRIEGDYTGVLHHTMVDDTNLGDWENQVDGKLLDPVTGTCTTDLTINGIATSPYQEDILFKLVDGRDEDGKRRTNRRISVRNLTSLPENFSRVHSVKLESVTEIIKSNMSYPGSAQVGSLIRANYLPRAPERTFHLKLKKVKVPSIYVENDDASQSRHPGTWDGTFKDELEWTDNPAWIFYDIATNERYGLGEYVKEENIDKWQLFKIAKYCDEPVPTSRENPDYNSASDTADKMYVQERRFSCNLFLNNKMEAYKALSEIASVFKGMAFYNGSEVYVSQDSLSEPVLNFTNSNVLEGNFTYHGSSKNTRFTAVKVAYKDKDDNFLPKYEYIEDPEGIIRHGLIEKESAALGCTSRDQALRLGRWILLTSNNEQEVVRFSTDKQGGYLRPGDVIGISDDNRTNFKSGGRVAKVVGDNATSVDENHILLDQTLDIDEANFKYLKISFIIPNSGKLSEDDEEGVGAEKQFKTFIHRDGRAVGTLDLGNDRGRPLIPLNSQTSENIDGGVDLHNYFEDTLEGTKIKTTIFLDMIQESPNKNDKFMQGNALHPGTLNDYFLESGVFQVNGGFVQHQDRANNNQQKITEGAVYIVEASGDARQQTKEFRVLAVAEEDDATFTIAALEYNRDKFKDVDSLSTIYKSSTQLISVTPSYGDTQPNDRQGVPPPTPESEIFTPTIIGGIPDNNVSLSINRTGDLDQNDGTFNPKIELYFFNDYGNEGQNVTHFDYKIQEISNVYYEKLKDAGSVEQATGLYHSLKDGSYVKNDKCGDFGEISFLTGSKGSEFYDPTIPNFRSDFTDKVISEVGVGIEKIEFSGIEKCAESNSTPSLHLYSGVKTEVGALKEETWHEIRWKASRKHTISDASSEEKVAFFRSSADITPPAKPSSFKGKILFNNLYEFNWENTADADLDLVRLYTGDGTARIGNPIYELQANPLTNQFHTFFIGNHPKLKNDINQDFYITSVDLAGNESIDSASVIVSRIGDSSSVPIIDVSSSFNSIERQSYVRVDIDSGNFNTNPGYSLSNPGADNDPNFEKYQVTIYESGTENILNTYDIVEEIDEHEVTYNSIGGKKYEARLDVVTKGGDYIFGKRSGILASGDDSIPEGLEDFEVDLHFGNRVEIEWTYPANVNDIEYVEIYSGSGIGELEPNTDPWPSTWAKVDEVPRSRSYETQYLTDSLRAELETTTNQAIHFAGRPIDYSDKAGPITSGTIHFMGYDTVGPGFKSSYPNWDTDSYILTGAHSNWEFSGHYEHAVQPSLLDPDFESFQAWVYNAENNNFLTTVDMDPVDHTGHYVAIPGKPLKFRLIAKRKTGDVQWSSKTPTQVLDDEIPPGKLQGFDGEIWFNGLYRLKWDKPPEGDIEKIQLYTGEPLLDNKADPANFLLERFEPTSQEILFGVEEWENKIGVSETFYATAVDFSNNTGIASDTKLISRLGDGTTSFGQLELGVETEIVGNESFIFGNIFGDNHPPDIEADPNFKEYRIRLWDATDTFNLLPLDTAYITKAKDEASTDIEFKVTPGKTYTVELCVHTVGGQYLCNGDSTSNTKTTKTVPAAEDPNPPSELVNFEGRIIYNELYKFNWDKPGDTDIEKIQLYTGLPDGNDEPVSANLLLERFEPTHQEIQFHVNDAGKIADLPVAGSKFYAVAVDFSNNTSVVSDVVEILRLEEGSPNFQSLEFEAGVDEFASSFITGNIKPDEPVIEGDPSFEEYRIRIWDKNSDSTFPVDTQYLDNAQTGEDIRYEGIPGKEYKIDFCVHTKDGNYICKSDLDVTLPADETGPSKIHPFKGRVIFNEWYKFNWPKPSDTDIEKIQLYTGLPNGSDEPVSANLLLERFEPTNEEILFHVNDAGKIDDLPVTGSEFYTVAVDFSDNTGIVSDVIEVSRIGDDPLDGATPALSNLELTLYKEYDSTEEKSYISGDISSDLPSVQDDPNFLRYRVQIYDNNNNNRLLETRFINETGIGPEFTYEAIPGKEYKIELSVQAEDFSYISIAPTQFVIAVTDGTPPADIENFNVKQVFDDLVFTWDAPPEEDCETIVICSGEAAGDLPSAHPFNTSKIYRSDVGKYSVFSEPTQTFFNEGFRGTIAFNAFAVDLSENPGGFTLPSTINFGLNKGADAIVTTGILESITPEGNTRYFLTGKACHDSVESESFHHGRFRVGPESHFALKSETYLVSDVEGTKCLRFSSEVLPNIEYKITLSLENSTNERLTKDHFEGEFKIPSDNIAPSEVTDLNASQIGNAFHVTWKDVNAEQDLKGYIVSTGLALNDLKEYSFVDKSQKFARVPLKNNSEDYFIGIKKQDTSLNVGVPVVEQVNFSYETWNSIAGNPVLSTSSDLDSEDGSYNVYIQADITLTTATPPADLESINIDLYKGNVTNRIIQTKTILLYNGGFLPGEDKVRFDGLLANQAYKVKATPIYLNGISGGSSALVEKTTGKDDTVPEDPNNFKVSVGAKQMYLTWEWPDRSSDLEVLNVYRISGVAISDPTNTEWKLENPKYTIEPGGNEGGSFIDADIETGNANGAISYAYAIQAVDRSLNTGNYIPSIPPQLPGSGITDDYIHGIKAGKILSDSITSHTIALGRKGNERGRFISEDVVSVSQGDGIYLDALNFRIGDPDGQGIFYTGEYEFGSNQEDRRFEIRGDMTAGTIDIGNNKKEAFSVNPEGEIMIGQVEAIKKEGLSYLYLGDTLPEVTGLFSSVRTTTDGFNVYLQDHFDGGGDFPADSQGQFKTSDMFLRVYKGGMVDTTDIKTYPITGHETEQKVGIYEKDSISYGTTDAYAVFDVRFLVTSDGILYAKQANIAGTVTASSFRADETMEIGEGGDKDPEHSILQSFNYDGTIKHPIPSGWRLQGHGKAQFYDVGIRGPNSYISGIDHLLVSGAGATTALQVNSDGEFAVGGDANSLSSNPFHVSAAGKLTAWGAEIDGDTTIGGTTLIGAGVKIGHSSNGVEITAAGLKSSAIIDSDPAWEIKGNGSASFKDVTSIVIKGGSIEGTTLDIGADPLGFHVDGDGDVHIGATDYADAPFTITTAGHISGSNAEFKDISLSGDMTISGTVDVTDGLRIGGAGASKQILFTQGGIQDNAREFFIQTDGEAGFKNINVTGGAIKGVALDIGSEAGIESFHVATNGNLHIGEIKTKFADAPFSVTNLGHLKAVGAEIAGTIVGDGLIVGEGTPLATENNIYLTQGGIYGPNPADKLFFIQTDGEAGFKNINVTGGAIAGVALDIGSNTANLKESFHVAANGNLHIGESKALFADAPFSVTNLGHLKARHAEISGTIEGKGLRMGAADEHVYLTAGGLFGPTHGNKKFQITNAGNAYFEQIAIAGGSIDGAVTLDVGNTAGTHGRAFHVDPDGRLSIGDEDTAPGSRKFEVTNGGDVTMEDLTLKGDLVAEGGIKIKSASNSANWIDITNNEISSHNNGGSENWVIGADGSAEFSDIKIDGGMISGSKIIIGTLDPGLNPDQDGKWFNVSNNGSFSIGSKNVIHGGGNLHTDNKFYVDTNGNLYAHDVQVSGELWAKEGSKIGGSDPDYPAWYVTSSAIQNVAANSTPTVKIQKDGNFKFAGITGTANDDLLTVGNIKSYDYPNSEGFNLQTGVNEPSTIPNFLTDDGSAKKIAEQVSTQFCGEILFPIESSNKSQLYTLISNNRVKYKLMNIRLAGSGGGTFQVKVWLNGETNPIQTITNEAEATLSDRTLDIKSATNPGSLQLEVTDISGTVNAIAFNIELQRII